MTLKRMTPVLLAASVALSGMAGVLVGAVSPSHAITSVDELSDVNRNHWAFDALRDLVEKYDVIEGYPDLTFRGNRQPTRWEMAAALNSLVKSIGRDLARLGAEKADKRDLQTVARLQEEFRNELNALNARTKALEDRAAAIEAKNAEQDTRLSLLEKTQIHGDMSVGFLSDISAQGPGTGTNDGILDGISAIGRLRLALDIPVKEEEEGSKWGRGDVYTRLIAAWGRNAPNGGNTFGGYSRIAADADKNNDGLFLNGNQDNSSGVNTRNNLYLEAAYYKQNIKEGVPVLTDWFGVWPDKENWETTGDAYVGVVPWRFLFDKSPYRGNELSQFQNTLLTNTPGVPVNLNQPTIAYALHQGLGENANLDFTTAIASVNGSDAYDGLNLTYEGRLNYLLDWWSNDAVSGSVYAGGYHAWLSGNSLGAANAPGGNGGFVDRAGATSADVTRGNRLDGFYAGWNQEWYKGIGTFVNGMMQSSPGVGYFLTSANQTNGVNSAFNANGTVVSARWALSGGLNVPMSAFGDFRPDDVFGLGYALVDFHNPGSENTGSRTLDDAVEQVIEAYYKYQFTESISVVPSAQFYFNRLGLGANDFTAVFGARMNFLF